MVRFNRRFALMIQDGSGDLLKIFLSMTLHGDAPERSQLQVDRVNKLAL